MATHPFEQPLAKVRVKIDHVDLRFPHEAVLTLILARDESGKVLGTVTVKSQKHVAEFNRLFVVREARRMGIGRRLLEFVIGAAQTGGCKAVSAVVHPDNADALAFYRELGFFEATRFDDGGVLMTCQL